MQGIECPTIPETFNLLVYQLQQLKDRVDDDLEGRIDWDEDAGELDKSIFYLAVAIDNLQRAGAKYQGLKSE